MTGRNLRKVNLDQTDSESRPVPITFHRFRKKSIPIGRVFTLEDVIFALILPRCLIMYVKCEIFTKPSEVEDRLAVIASANKHCLTPKQQNDVMRANKGGNFPLFAQFTIVNEIFFPQNATLLLLHRPTTSFRCNICVSWDPWTC